MSEAVRVLLLRSGARHSDDGFEQALTDALRRAGIAVEEADLSADTTSLLDSLERTTLPIVFKPC